MNHFSPEWLGSLFADALSEIVLKFTGLALHIKSSEPDSGFSDITGLMNMVGTDGGTVFISADEGDLKVLCSCMLGVPKEEVTADDMEDALCELVNMTVGNVKLRLGNEGSMLTLTTPFAMKGIDMTLVTKSKVNIISVLMGNDELLLKMKVIY